jgi:hypothetical protein
MMEASSSDQQVMINVTRGSNLQLIPLTEVLSPKNLQSPQNINYSSMMIEHQNSIVNHLPRDGIFSPPDSQYMGQTAQIRQTLLSEEKSPSQLTGSNIQFLNSFERNDSQSQKFRVGAVRAKHTVVNFVYIDFKPISRPLKHDNEQPTSQCVEQSLPSELVLREQRWKIIQL